MAPLTVRKEERYRESVPVLYQGDGMIGEGFLDNLSLNGGRIVGNVPVLVGRSLALRFSLPGETEPFQFDQATVRWIRGLEFGVDLGPRPPEMAERFARVITIFAEKHHGSTS